MNTVHISSSLSLSLSLTLAAYHWNWQIQMSKHWVIAPAFPPFNHHSLNSYTSSHSRIKEVNSVTHSPCLGLILWIHSCRLHSLHLLKLTLCTTSHTQQVMKTLHLISSTEYFILKDPDVYSTCSTMSLFWLLSPDGLSSSFLLHKKHLCPQHRFLLRPPCYR